MQLFGFADASEAAYAAWLTDQNGKISVSLVASKLELNAAVLLTDLVKQVMQSLSHLDVTCYAMTDSKIVLGGQSSDLRKWKTFIANCTSMILEFIPRSSWNHVASADCAQEICIQPVTQSCSTGAGVHQQI